MANAYIEWYDGSQSSLEDYEWFTANFDSVEDFEAKEEELWFWELFEK